MTPHIQSKLEEIEKTVLMPGDPLRATYIAEHFLTNAKLVNSVRGILAYTGTYQNTPITVMASGMGNPSMGIYSYELFHFYQVENIIRIGTLGSYSPDLNLKDIVLVKSSYSNSSYAKNQNGCDSRELFSSQILNTAIQKTANKLEIPIHFNTVFCSDVFYSEVEDYSRLFQEKHCVGVEMETFALFNNSHILKKQATCLLSVSNSFVKPGELSPEERQTSLHNMITLALESASSLSSNP